MTGQPELRIHAAVLLLRGSAEALRLRPLHVALAVAQPVVLARPGHKTFRNDRDLGYTNNRRGKGPTPLNPFEKE